jgi:fumarate reductase subunit D
MKTIVNSILLKIAESVDGTSNKVSSSRVQSYIILFPILLMVLVFLIIEIWAFGHAIDHGMDYKLSSEIIIVFGMMLSHHLAILFSRTKSQSVAEIQGSAANKEEAAAEVPVEEPTEEPVEEPTDEKK